MITSTHIDLEKTNKIFGNHTGHIETKLKRLPNARLIWLNQRIINSDPQFKKIGSLEKYKKHLVHQCAFALADHIINIHHVPDSITATADRYGGDGIGCNGGSGRAAYINGYHLKGIGRTQLVVPDKPLKPA